LAAIEISGPADGLIDEPLALRARGATSVNWRARLRDDDSRVWKAGAARADELIEAWVAAKETTGAVAALASLRPVRVTVRAEAPDGRSAERALTRRFVADGVKVRRWRDGDLRATLFLPAATPVATVIATDTSTAAALLASRGVLVLLLAGGDAGRARELLAAVPDATEPVELELPLPPGVPARMSRADAAARGPAWDALLARLDGNPRVRD
jgi:predicted polyphosphate/ATP-dependent NAD kinase